MGMISLPSNQSDDEAQLIEQLRVLRSANVCGTIGALAERDWNKALIRAGAAGFLVSVAQLYSPRCFENPDFILDLLPCYDAFSSLFSRSSIVETGTVWVTEIAVESELVTAFLIGAFIVEARRTLDQHPVTGHWGLSVRASALAALSRAFAVLQDLLDAEANYLRWVERDGPAGEVQGGWPSTPRNSSGSFFILFWEQQLLVKLRQEDMCLLCGFKTRMRWSLFKQKAASCFAFIWADLRLIKSIHSFWLCLSTAMLSNASCKEVLTYFGGTNSRRAAGHAGAPEIFILGKFNTKPCTPRSARFPRASTNQT